MTRESFPTPLVSTAWLAAHLGQPWVKVIDASTYLPSSGRDAHAEYLAGHIAGAQFCDIGSVSDASALYPHTLPSAAMFAERLGSLGISNSDAIVVYDTSGQHFSAPRLWWMLRAFGHANVAVLDGGLGKWVREGHAVTTDVPDLPPVEFTGQFDLSRVRDLTAMRDNVTSPLAQVVDARSAGRFYAREPEPRVGVRGGHMPHSVNVHYASLVQDDGTMRPASELRAIMAAAGVDLARPIVASCGSGVTACTVVLALDAIGVTNTAVYDGSWTEWGSGFENPVVS